MRKCQLCGSLAETDAESKYMFKCKTITDGYQIYRGTQCYETERAARKARLQEAEKLLKRCQIALGMMRYVDKYHLFYGDEDSVESIEHDLQTFLTPLEPEKEKL